jgi:hypothetical protein
MFSTTEPQDSDVLFRKGGTDRCRSLVHMNLGTALSPTSVHCVVSSGQVGQHPGNRRFHKVIGEQQGRWRNAASNREKRAIVEGCIHAIVSQKGGRFLEYSPESGVWRELEKDRLIEKISRSFRDSLRAVRSQGANGNAEATTLSFQDVRASDFRTGKGGTSHTMDSQRCCAADRICSDVTSPCFVRSCAASVMHHGGNVRLRELLPTYVTRYEASPRDQKSSVVRKLIEEWRSLTPEHPGRFLKRAQEPGAWCELSDAEASALVQKMLLRKPTTKKAPPPADQGAADTLLELSSSACASSFPRASSPVYT